MSHMCVAPPHSIICTLYFVLCTLYFVLCQKHYGVFVLWGGAFTKFNGSWIRKGHTPTHRFSKSPQTFIPKKFNVQGSGPERDGTQTLNFKLLPAHTRRLLLYERRSTPRKWGEVIVKNYKLWCVHNFLWRFRFTTSPGTITPSGFAIHPFFHKEGDGLRPHGVLSTQNTAANCHVLKNLYQ